MLLWSGFFCEKQKPRGDQGWGWREPAGSLWFGIRRDTAWAYILRGLERGLWAEHMPEMACIPLVETKGGASVLGRGSGDWGQYWVNNGAGHRSAWWRREISSSEGNTVHSDPCPPGMPHWASFFTNIVTTNHHTEFFHNTPGHICAN